MQELISGIQDDCFTLCKNTFVGTKFFDGNPKYLDKGRYPATASTFDY